MGFLDELIDALLDDDGDDWGDNYYQTCRSSNNGRRRYVVNYLSTNGMICGTEVIAFNETHARSCVSCRSDVKCLTSSYEVK